MIQPKDLYRELAAPLAIVDKGSTKHAFRFSFATKLENTFFRDLHINNSRLDLEALDRSGLVKPADFQKRFDPDGVITSDTVTVQHILRKCSYIFTNPPVCINNQTSEQGEYAIHS